jgi:Co/Zn/Cd efflux system component
VLKLINEDGKVRLVLKEFPILSDDSVAAAKIALAANNETVRPIFAPAWICSRNDVIGNLAVLLAALGVFGTRTLWPDVVVAMAMATLALQGSATVIKQSLDELNRSQSLVVEDGK